jgi:soluble lytic murein transglycosylase
MPLAGIAGLSTVLWAAGSAPVTPILSAPQTAVAPISSATDDRLTEMLAAFEQGKLGPAMKAAHDILNSRASPADQSTARLVEAFALLGLKRSAEAERALDDLAVHGPDLGNYLGFLRASVLAARRNCEGAEAALRGLPPESSFANPGWSRVTSCWLNRQVPDRADAAAGRMTETADSLVRRAEALLMTARVAESRGDKRDARDIYRQVLVGFPLTAAGRIAGERLETLKNRGMNVRALFPEELLPQAETERAAQHAGKARTLYASIIDQAKGKKRQELKQAAELGLVELDLVDRRYPKALKRLDALIASIRDDDIAARALYLKADILSRKGQVGRAMETYDRAVTAYPATRFAAEAALAAARLAYGTRDFDRARVFADWMLTAPELSGDDIEIIGGDGAFQSGHDGLKDYGLWLIAWIERRRGSPADVTDSYLAQIDSDSPLANAATYWRARLAIERGDFADAEVYANLLAKKRATSFYTLAMSDLLRRVNPGCDVRLDIPTLPGTTVMETPAPVSRPNDLLGALVLFRHGLATEAQRVAKMLPPMALGATDRTVAAWLYRRCGDVHRAAVLTRRLAEEATEVQDPVLLDLAYPRPYADLVLAAAALHDVPVDLVYAVIRQESAFNPKAVSPRRAFGLMQMIKPTARRLAEDTDLGRITSRRLFDPEIAIDLGTRYLAELLKRFDGNVPAAVAAYHAGELTVDRWLKTRGTLEPDEFIEEIPFSTTRTYVKTVLASFGIYRLLYQDGVRQAIRMSVPVSPTSELSPKALDRRRD